MWIEEDILMIKLRGEIDEEEVKEINKRGIELLEKIPGKIIYYLVDISDVKKATAGARKATKNITFVPDVPEKIALVYNNPLTRVLGSMFLRIAQPKVPTKLFSAIEEAKKWFKEK